MKKIVNSFSYACQGLIHAFRTERNVRFHFWMTIIVLLSALVLGVTRLEMIILLLTISLVIVMELINTGIEEMVDIICPQYNEKAKVVKNIAAGAVLVSAINAIIVGLLVFSKHFNKISSISLSLLKIKDPHFFLIIITNLMIIIFVLKMRYGKRISLKGGMPSGHSALAFSLATVSALLSNNIYSIVMGYMLAFLVAQSRVEGNIHTPLEVIWGSLLGVSLTLIFALLS